MVEGNLPDVEPFTEVFDEFLDVSVVDDVALGGFEISLPLPDIVGNMVELYSQVERFFRHPEVRQDAVLVILVLRREHQYERRDVQNLFMLLIADGMRIIARRGYEEEQRLHPRIAGALRHDIFVIEEEPYLFFRYEWNFASHIFIKSDPAFS